MKTDYIIVGSGFAAMFFAHQLIKHKKDFILFSDNLFSASRIAAGMINPVVLKRFTKFWKTNEQIDYLKVVLSEIQSYTHNHYYIESPIHRIFHDDNEKNLWLKKTNSSDLSLFFNKNFIEIDHIENNFECGVVNHSGRLNVNLFFKDMINYLSKNNHLINETFNYTSLNIDDLKYKDIQYNKIVFCEGIHVKNNPFFNFIDIIENKGHHLKVKLSKEINKSITIKKKHFLFPIENEDTYYYGGTYDRDNLLNKLDDEAISSLKEGLNEFYKFPFVIEDIKYGFRPTTYDRRPIIGKHHIHSSMYVFNGLGARGVLNSSYFSNDLYHFIENNISLDPEIDCNRFLKK